MKSAMVWRDAEVARIDEIADDIRMVAFRAPGAVPRYEPGEHLNIRVIVNGEADTRSYTSLPRPDGLLRIAVKKSPTSKGGSAFVHNLKLGDKVALTLPENRFPLNHRAAHYLLIAGGIGITPIYSMATALAHRRESVRMLYAAHSRGALAFHDELAKALGDRLETFVTEDGRRLDLAAEIAAAPRDAECYFCGPIQMLEEARRAWAADGRNPAMFRFESFGDSGRLPSEPFDVIVPAYDKTVRVAENQTMLDALAEAGVYMIRDCRRGECGLCAVRVLEHSGEIDHRDVFFSDEEKAAGDRMCACVSRVAGGSVTIDTGYRP